MKKRSKRNGRGDGSDVFEAFSSSDADVTITPFLSAAEVCKRYGGGSSRSNKDDAPVRDAFGTPDTDLWNKGSKNFRQRRRQALAEGKSGRGWSKEQPAEPEERPKRSKRNRNVGSEPGERGDAVGLRIIGGRLRGTKLEYGGDRRVRPMKERVREAIFNLLGEKPKGRHVVDLFAGTGALALEALSRGARSATMIEVHFPTARVTRRNLELLDEKERGIAAKAEIVTTDVFFWGRKLAATDPNAPPPSSPIENLSQATLPTDVPWLVFCSPPYDFWVDREGEMLELLDVLKNRAPDGSIFIVETDDRFDFALLEVEIPKRKRRSYPPAEIAVFTVDRSLDEEEEDDV